MPSFNKLVISAAVGASLLLAACGGSSHKTTGPSTASSSPPASQPTSSASGALTIGTVKASVGTYLTGASGRALYVWLADSKGKSSCAEACAAAWPPLTASTMPKVTGGVNPADISLISRSDGTKQVAYQGRPLYYYAGDTGPGTTNGQGSNQFGAKWWLIAPSGGQVTGSSSTATSSGASSGGYGGASGGYGGSSGGYGGSSGGSSGSPGSPSGSSGGASGSTSEGSSGSSSGGSWG